VEQEDAMKPAVQDWTDPAWVAEWLGNRTAGNPGRQAQLEMLLTLLGQVQPRGLRVLDLGCGDGLVAELILQQLPESYVAGTDFSPPMLEAAAARLRAYPGRYALYRRALDDGSPLAGEGPFDAVIGIQSIHHLDRPGKQALFAWVADHLRPGGLFLLSDRVMLAAAALFPYHQALYAAQQARHGGPPLPAGYGYAAHLHTLGLRADLPDTVEDQLTWLRAAGFGAADCFYRSIERAVFGGLKVPPTPAGQADPADTSAAGIAESSAANGIL
jgi:tRNA (cmo5U34)-methyltransferase